MLTDIISKSVLVQLEIIGEASVLFQRMFGRAHSVRHAPKKTRIIFEVLPKDV